MNIRYRVSLIKDERAALEALVSSGKRAVRRIKRAQLLLAADAGNSTDEAIAHHVGVSISTVYRTKQWTEEGTEGTRCLCPPLPTAT